MYLFSFYKKHSSYLSGLIAFSVVMQACMTRGEEAAAGGQGTLVVLDRSSNDLDYCRFFIDKLSKRCDLKELVNQQDQHGKTLMAYAAESNNKTIANFVRVVQGLPFMPEARNTR